MSFLCFLFLFFIFASLHLWLKGSFGFFLHFNLFQLTSILLISFFLSVCLDNFLPFRISHPESFINSHSRYYFFELLKSWFFRAFRYLSRLVKSFIGLKRIILLNTGRCLFLLSLGNLLLQTILFNYFLDCFCKLT